MSFPVVIALVFWVFTIVKHLVHLNHTKILVALKSDGVEQKHIRIIKIYTNDTAKIKLGVERQGDLLLPK